MKFLQSRKEKDFELFVRALPTLEAVEFAGLAKLLSVKLVDGDAISNMTKEQLDAMSEEDRLRFATEAVCPMDEILEKMMDRYLELSKRRRKEINQILKEIKVSKNEVNTNGATT